MSTANLRALESVVGKLGDLVHEMVFVGGRVAELLVTDPGAVRIRPTDDSDAVCEMASYSAYHQVEERLTRLGFSRDMRPGAPICRWTHGSDVIDVMPDDEAVLGFRNAWYRHVLRLDMPYEVAKGTTIRIAQAPVFLATKWDAFSDRGTDDWYGSHDLEDIVTVVAGRRELVEETRATEEDVRGYLADRCRLFLDAGFAEDVIAGALPDATEVPGLVKQVWNRFQEIATLAPEPR